MRLLNLGLLLMLIALQASLWFGEGSISHYVGLKSQISQQALQITEMQQRNDALAREVYQLQNGYHAIEAFARSQLGMIKADETFYLVIDN